MVKAVRYFAACLRGYFCQRFETVFQQTVSQLEKNSSQKTSSLDIDRLSTMSTSFDTDTFTYFWQCQQLCNQWLQQCGLAPALVVPPQSRPHVRHVEQHHGDGQPRQRSAHRNEGGYESRADSENECAPKLDKSAADGNIDADYLQFVRATIAHRRQRDEQRAKERQREEEQRASGSGTGGELGSVLYVDDTAVGRVEGLAGRTHKPADTWRHAQNQRTQMQQLYGGAADNIVARQTAVDLHFAQCAQVNATYWPVIPLKL